MILRSHRIGALLLLAALQMSGVPGVSAAAASTSAKKPAAKPVVKVPVSGSVGALVRGTKTAFVFLGQIRRFEVLLESAKPHATAAPLMVATDVHGAFKFPAVPVGDYRIRVRVPTIPWFIPNAELYRQAVTVRSGLPSLDLRMPFTLMHVVGADGMPQEWEQIQVAVRRRGEALNQDWQSGFTKRQGANPTGPLEEQGSIIVEMNGTPGNVSIGFSWQSHDKTSLLLPLVEEDGPARYRLMLNGADGTGAILHFSGSRGKTPAELEARLLPHATVVGTTQLQGLPTGSGSVKLQLTVYHDQDRTDLLFSMTTDAAADGSFRFEHVPVGIAWISASVDRSDPGAHLPPFSNGVEAPIAGPETRLMPLSITPTSALDAETRHQKFLHPETVPPVVPK